MGQLDDIAVFYGNFNYLQKVRHQIVGDHGEMLNYTTAKLVRGGMDRIPPGGLTQDMLRNERPMLYDPTCLRANAVFSNGWFIR